MQRYEVARLTARKAVRVLADEGLVEVVPGRGAYVIPARPSGAFDTARQLWQADPRIDPSVTSPQLWFVATRRPSSAVHGLGQDFRSPEVARVNSSGKSEQRS